jgi:hypothetical protein
LCSPPVGWSTERVPPARSGGLCIVGVKLTPAVISGCNLFLIHPF